jgi:transcriptional regulator with XRE-family HTH domain
MSRTLQSKRHEALIELLIAERKKAGLTQADVAAKLGRYQSHVASIESGQRRIDVVEFLALAEAIGFNAQRLIGRLARQIE